MLTDRELMEQYRERMLYLENERHEWIGELQVLRTENNRMKRGMLALAKAIRGVDATAQQIANDEPALVAGGVLAPLHRLRDRLLRRRSGHQSTRK